MAPLYRSVFSWSPRFALTSLAIKTVLIQDRPRPTDRTQDSLVPQAGDCGVGFRLRENPAVRRVRAPAVQKGT